jgi:GDP-D-mannose 3',5'-epimerase
MKEKVVVTGAGGFIGHHLCRYLKSLGYFVRGVDIHKPEFSGMDDFNEFKILDLRSLTNCVIAVEGMDKVYALAAENGSIEYTTTNRAELVHSNTLINLNTAEACRLEKVKRLFFSSSACVYPLHLQESCKDSLPLKEQDAYPANPDSEYGWEKLFSERLYQSYAIDHGLEVRIARFFNIYGPECLIDTLRSKAPMALTRKIIEAGAGGIVDVWGTGDAIRSYCYVDDCVKAIHMLMESDITEPINIGTDNHVSVDNLVTTIAIVNGTPIEINHQLDKVEGVKARLCNFDKAKKLLGWESTTSMSEGLRAVNEFVHEQLKK